jgi:hypothetical protein
MPPTFVFTDTFDTTIPIGDRALPIHIQRLSKAELEALDTQWTALMVVPRGSADVPAMASEKAQAAAEARRVEDWSKSVEVERLKWFDATIREYITLDEGVMTDRGKSVTDGAGLIGVFHGRKDVLGALVAAVVTENHLLELFRKNSSSPSGSGPGSPRKSPAGGGDVPALTAGSVGSSSSASRAAVTDDLDDDPSGGSTAPARPH